MVDELVNEDEACSAIGIADILIEGGGAVQAAGSGGFICLVFPLLAASSRMRVTRVVSWTKSSVARVPSPAITDPAARAKRNASAWSSKYKMTCPDIDTSPESDSPMAEWSGRN
jgi:hypothetical protein